MNSEHVVSANIEAAQIGHDFDGATRELKHLHYTIVAQLTSCKSWFFDGLGWGVNRLNGITLFFDGTTFDGLLSRTFRAGVSNLWGSIWSSGVLALSVWGSGVLALSVWGSGV